MTLRACFTRRRRADRVLPQMPSTASASDLPPTWRLRFRRLPLIMRIGTLGILIAGLADLAGQWHEVQPGGLDVLMLIDVSQSMRAQDASPDRLGAVTSFAHHVIESRPRDRFGVLLFAGEDALACPLTADHDAVLARLSAIEASAGSGTAIGTAILGALKRLPEPRNGSVLLVFTDGASNAGDRAPLEAALIASQEHARIFAVGVGRTGMAPFPTEAGLVEVPTEVDEQTMREMTEAVGGVFVRAGDSGAVTAVTDALARIPSSRPSAGGDASVVLWIASLAGLILSTELVLAVLVLEIRS